MQSCRVSPVNRLVAVKELNPQMRAESLNDPGASGTTLAQLRERSERLTLALDAACIGTWAWDLRDNQVVWDDRIHRLFGLRPGSFSGDFDAFLKMVHPEDLEAVKSEVMRAVDGTE